MKLWKLFTSALITWNTFGIILLLWRYQGTWDRKSRKLEQVWLRNVDHGTEVVPTSKVDLQSPDSLERHVIPTMRTSDSRKFREEHLNVPPIYLNRSRLRLNRRPTKVKTPLFFPDIQDLKFNNIYWQTTMILETTFYLYGAYHDDRKLNQNGQGPALIRILGMVDHMPPPLNVKCAFWFDEGKRMIWSTWISYEHLWRRYWGNVRNGTLQPLLISCALPPQDGLPEMVSLVGVGTRKPSTNLRIQKHFSMVQKDFGVCVKGLDFPTLDLSLKLLEWAHLLRLLGADRIFFYELEVHPNVAIVLDYLESKEMAEVIPLTLPGYQPNQSLLRNVYLQRMMGVKRLNEIIPYNDCLYRNLHRYRFLLLLDIDEVIMPISSDSWMGLMRQVHSIIELNKPKVMMTTTTTTSFLTVTRALH